MSSLFLNDKKKSQALGCLPISLRIIRQRSTNKRANERKKNAHQNEWNNQGNNINNNLRKIRGRVF